MKTNNSTTFQFSIDKFEEKIKQSFLGISLLVILQLFLSVTIQAQDEPLSVVNTFYGNYDSNTHGVTFYPDITSNSFDIDLATCSDGNAANIVNAYFVWQQRWRSQFNDLVTTPTFDNSFDAQFNGGASQTITSTADYESKTLSGSDRVIFLYTGYADVTSQISSLLTAGTNTVSISNLNIPTPDPPNTVLQENWGVSLVIVYECAEYPESTIQISAGSDFFWCNNSQEPNDDYSHINSFTFPATTSELNGTLEGVFGGSNEGTAPFRGGDICYVTGTGTPPVSTGTAVAPTGDVVNDPSAICSPNPTWVASLGTEWDEFSTPVTIPAGSEYISVQSHSEENVGVSSSCGSLAAASYIFKFDGDPFQMGTPCDPILETVCDDATDSATLTADAGLTNYQWYNEAGILAGETGQTLVVDSNTPGMADGSEDFYYEATDGDGCPGELCCPVSVEVMNCCNINAIVPQNLECIDNGTPALITDNRIRFNAMVTNTNTSLTGYNVTINGGTTITPNTNVAYGITQFLLGPGTAGGGATFTITVTDSATPGCTQTFQVVDPGTCTPATPECPPVQCGTATIQVNGN